MSATQRELLEECWSVITRDVQRLSGEYDISGINSPRWQRIDDTLYELAAMLVDEVSGDELDSLLDATEGIWQVIRERLLAWAEATEAAREKRRAAAA